MNDRNARVVSKKNLNIGMDRDIYEKFKASTAISGKYSGCLVLYIFLSKYLFNLCLSLYPFPQRMQAERRRWAR